METPSRKLQTKWLPRTLSNCQVSTTPESQSKQSAEPHSGKQKTQYSDNRRMKQTGHQHPMSFTPKYIAQDDEARIAQLWLPSRTDVNCQESTTPQGQRRQGTEPKQQQAEGTEPIQSKEELDRPRQATQNHSIQRSLAHDEKARPHATTALIQTR